MFSIFFNELLPDNVRPRLLHTYMYAQPSYRSINFNSTPSYNDFEIAAANLLDNAPRRVSDRITAYALFTDPALGRVGMTEAEVRASGRPALRGVLPMTRV